MKTLIAILLLLSGCASRYPDYTMYKRCEKTPNKWDNIAKEAVKATNENLKQK